MKQDKINRVLNCSYKEFLEIYKDQNSQNDYHLKRGDINISFTNWITSSDNNNNFGYGSETTNNEERTIKFQAPINAPQSVLKIIGKNATTINEQQKIHVNHKQSTIDIETFYQPDIMGEYFSVETEWHLKTLSAPTPDSTQQQQCSLELIIRVTFNMSFVGNLFEVFIVKAASESALQYVDIVEEYLVKLNIEKQQQQQLQKQQLQQQQLQLKQKEQQLQFLQQQQQQLQLKQKEQQQQHNNKPKNKKEKTNKKNRQQKQKPYENWTVDCNIDQIKGDLNHHLDTLRLNSLDASQGLLKVEISISEMQSEQQLIQQQQQLQLQLHQQQQQHLQLQNVNNNQQLQLQLPNSPTNSSTSTSADSSSSFLSPYNLGLTDISKNRQLQQYNNQQQLQQQQQQQQLQNQYLQQQQQQQNHNISDLLSQIELNNRALKEQRLVSEERVEDEIKSISQYFEDMLKLQEESKPWFPSFINISLVIVVVAVALSIFSKFKHNGSPIKPIIAVALTTANSIGGNNSGSNNIINNNTRNNKIFN